MQKDNAGSPGSTAGANPEGSTPAAARVIVVPPGQSLVIQWQQADFKPTITQLLIAPLELESK